MYDVIDLWVQVSTLWAQVNPRLGIPRFEIFLFLKVWTLQVADLRIRIPDSEFRICKSIAVRFVNHDGLQIERRPICKPRYTYVCAMYDVIALRVQVSTLWAQVNPRLEISRLEIFEYF